MAPMCIPFILTQEYPTAAWQVVGDDDNYDGLDWRAEDIDKPSQEVLEALWDQTYRVRWEEICVRRSRAVAFAERPLGDQLDAIIKGLKAAQAAGVELPADTAQLIAWSDSIKAAHPKPVVAANG
jgi:hypothetical protein